MTQWDISDRPNLFPWPPVLLGIAVLVGLSLRELYPVPIASSTVSQGLGVVMIAGALALDVWASLTFRKAKTTILPHRGSDALVTGGPFAFSRNPIYLGNLLILGGLGLLLGSVWHIALIAPLGIAINRLAIAREEAHLSARFPDAWQAYSSKVRRWV
ncbi:MAG: isoprenylcysteine carboxylmethyltransferase family protein [Devosiaceae bacterium]|nr:isoprenylcysteine carboxylmethyltransferase family protein [Devosiaceae bacterium MH13]